MIKLILQKLKLVLKILVGLAFTVFVVAWVHDANRQTRTFTIIGKAGNTTFTVPREWFHPCCIPVWGETDSTTIFTEAKNIKNMGKYSIRLMGNYDDNRLIGIQNRFKKAYPVESEFEGYKKFNESKWPDSPFLLLGKTKSGEPIYLSCYAQTKTKCRYHGKYNDKLFYQFSFPKNEIDNLENLVIYANKKISSHIVKE